MYYLIKESLIKSTAKEIENTTYPYVIVFDSISWQNEKGNFPYAEDLLEEDLYYTKADVNFHCLSGSFSIPNHENLDLDDSTFLFLLNEKGIIFVDDSGYVNSAISYITKTKKWIEPSIERFLYDLLDYIVKDDLRIMERYEMTLEEMEDDSDNQSHDDLDCLNRIRSEIRRYNTHYEELIDLTQEFYENENSFFNPSNLHYFKSCLSRIERLSNTTYYLRDYVLQINDTYREKIAEKQSNITTLLTVITTIFAPLTLITGWYGMNFKYMPELSLPISYPIVFIVALVIAISLLYYFKKKKWL